MKDFMAACFQARLQTFGWQETRPKAKKPRRASSRTRGKKSAADSDEVSWPLSSPVPYDLAFAGFIFNPTSASPDNVQCFECGCQLDGWESEDIPAYEHLTHSPKCGTAIIVALRLRINDPDRVDEDPMGNRMIEARRKTFGDFWTLDTSAGFPGVDQMVEAGWFYDPSDDDPDGVTCPYCSISVGGWEAGDDPLEEHRRRAEKAETNCLFFTLKELYHPENIPHIAPDALAPKAKGKRASSRSARDSIASTASVTTKKTKAKTTKTTRTKAAAKTTTSKTAKGKKQVEVASSDFGSDDLPLPPPAPPARSKATKKAVSKLDPVDVPPSGSGIAKVVLPSFSSEPDEPPPPPKGRITRRQSKATDIGSDDHSIVKPPVKRGRAAKRQSEQTDVSFDMPPPEPVRRGRAAKRQSEQTDVSFDLPAPAPEPVKRGRAAKRQSEQTDISFDGPLPEPQPAPVRKAARGRAAKRQSEQTDVSFDMLPPVPAPAPEAMRPARLSKRQSELTDPGVEEPAPAPKPTKTAKATKRKSDQIETLEEPIRRMSKRLRASDLEIGSSVPTFSENLPAALQSTPPHVFQSPPPRLEMQALRPATPPQVETPTRATTPESSKKWDPVDIDAFFEKENLPAIKELTSPEKKMTIEGFLMYEARRQEGILREQMELQIEALDVQYNRALTAIDDL